MFKPNTLQSARHIILESWTDCILPVHGTCILQETHYTTGKLMPIRFSIVDTKNEVIISHVSSTQPGLLKVLFHNRAAQHRHLDAIRKHSFQPENTSKPATIYSFLRLQNNCMFFLRPFSNNSSFTRP